MTLTNKTQIDDRNVVKIEVLVDLVAKMLKFTQNVL